MKEHSEKCPHCGRLIHVYHRTITAAMAAALIAIYRRGKGGWVHLPTFKMRFGNVRLRAALAGGDVSKLRFWKLLSPHPDRSGYWSITKAGEKFCRGTRKVPKYVDILLGRPIGKHGPQIGIVEALRQKFDYNELMGL